ncbi:MAG: terpene cyclase/mutase family protein [Chloroflexia bacterium]|nr:terpene cyclase/mutase family protein [Chloroflexia bacterium]
MNIRKALAYVREQGDNLALARALALIEQRKAEGELLTRLQESQGSNGGWAASALEETGESPAGTIDMLWALLDLGLHQEPMAQRGLEFLHSQQQDEGAWWQPAPEQEPLPFWQRHGNEAASLYLTARASAVLVAYDRADTPAAERALDALLKHQQHDGTFVGLPCYTSWQALPMLARRLGRNSGPAQNILNYSSRQLAENDWSPAMFGAMLRNLLLAGYGMDNNLVRRAWEQLLLRQAQDGSWHNEQGTVATVHSTLQVIFCWRWITQGPLLKER